MMVGATNRALGEKLGSGRSGVVYRDAFDPGRAVKVLSHPTAEAIDRIRAAIALEVPSEVPGTRTRLAWPTALQLNAAGLACGFVMPIAAGVDPVVLGSVLNRAERQRPSSGPHLRAKLQLAAAAAAVVGHCHDYGVIVGGLEARDLMLSRDGWVTGIGCDSLRFRGVDGRRRHDPSRWAAHRPTLGGGAIPQKAVHGIPHDRFALAVFLAGLLGCGLQASDVSVPREGAKVVPRWDLVPERLAALLEASLTREAHWTRQASAWELHDEAVRALGKLTLCDGPARHYFPREQPSCPWCGDERRRAARRIASPPPPERSQGQSPPRLAKHGRFAKLAAATGILAITAGLALGGEPPLGASPSVEDPSRGGGVRSALATTAGALRPGGTPEHVAFVFLISEWNGAGLARPMVRIRCLIHLPGRSACQADGSDVPSAPAPISVR